VLVFLRFVVSALTLVLGPAAQGPPTVVRGPYLQLGTPESVVVRWRTDVATDSRVLYGIDPGNLASETFDLAVGAEHSIALLNLLPDTTYYYAVGTTTEVLAGGDAEHHFTTAPVDGTGRWTRIWVLGDSGTADANARAVRDAFEIWNGGQPLDLWLMLGDNAYNDGTDPQYQAAVFDTYPSRLRTDVLWPTFGNHDGRSAFSGSQTGPYYEVFTLPTAGEAGGVASGTEAYYSFDHAGVHFVCLNSHDVGRTPGSPMLTWLAADLAANDAEWTIAFWHHAPYTKGSHDSDVEPRLVEMRENVVPILEAHGVDLVLTGHSHSYERSFLLDGHYETSDTLDPAMVLDDGDGQPNGDGPYAKATPGPAPHEGTVYVVAGSSGKVSGGSLDHPAMFVSISSLGSLVIEIYDRVLTATFLDATGTELDGFTLAKDGGNPLPIFTDSFESGDVDAWSGWMP